MKYMIIMLLLAIIGILAYCNININFNIEKKMIENLNLWNEVQNKKVLNQSGGIRFDIIYNKNIIN